MMGDIPVLSLIILLPVIGALITFMLGKRESLAKWVALVFSAAAFVLSLVVAYEFVVDPYAVPDTEIEGYSNGYQFYESHVWIESLGINYIVGIDGISLTIGEVSGPEFTVNLIPETLQRTTIGLRAPGDLVNIEIDPQTQAIVDTVERVLAERESGDS